MKGIDVISIGAINFDYMFNCKKTESKNSDPDDGSENNGKKNRIVEEEIAMLLSTSRSSSYSTQIGGSSLLALKTIHAVDKSLSLAFVGVCGQLNDFDSWHGKNINIDSELSFIDNREWLFFTDNNCLGDTKYIGKSVVKLNNSNTRGNINIAPNANELLLDYIKKHEKSTNTSFVDFLSQARWIHISSLNNINHFCEIMEYIKKAKKKNRYLQVSVDPGDEYTRRYQDLIQNYLKIADYVFLNKKEYNNLVLNESFSENDKRTKLSSYFYSSDNIDTKVFIIKHKNHHQLIDFVNGRTYVYYHRTLPFYKINNDTGAGDCFAGGFIAGMLSNKLLAQQPAPISLGVLCSRARMTAVNNKAVFDNIEKQSEKFFYQKYKDGELNVKQRVRLFFQSHIDFVLGFISSLIISYICSLLI